MRRVAALVPALLLSLPAVATADWRVLRSANFRVIGDASAGQLRNVALKLEQFRAAVGILNPGALREDAAPPSIVFVFRDERSYEPFLPRDADDRPIRVGGFFQPAQDANYITLSIQSEERAYRVIFHEYSHLLLRGLFADAPVWFNEGLAEYYSTFQVTADGRRAYIGRAVAEHVNLLARRRLPLARFFAINRTSEEYTRNITERDVFYAQSWAIVHHAFHGESQRRAQLLEFATRVAAGSDAESTFRDVYGIDLQDLEDELQLYVRQPGYRYSGFDFDDEIVTRLDEQAILITDAEADAWLGSLLARMGRLEEASARLEAALASAPDMALAHGFLGALQVREDQAEEGLGHLERAYALGIDNEAVLLSYASVLTRGPRESEALSKAQDVLERALELRPGYTEAKLLLAYVLQVTGDDEAARDLLRPVVEAEPSNHRVALRLADSLLRLDALEDARALLGGVLARTTDAGERERARALLGEMARRMTRRETLRAAGMDAADGGPASAAGGTPPSPPASAGTRRFVPAFRQVRPGEERVYGVFQGIECRPGGVTLQVRTANGLLLAQAEQLLDVDFITYRPLDGSGVNCGPRANPEEVYLTWIAASGEPNAGTAVAVEILPEGFVPNP